MMKRMLAAILFLLATCPALAQTIPNFGGEISGTFPDNTQGEITPSNVRAFQQALINLFATKQDYPISATSLPASVSQDLYFDASLTSVQIAAVRACTATFDSAPILSALEAMVPTSGILPNNNGTYGAPGPRIIFGAGCYPFSESYSVKHAVTLMGVGPGGPAAGPTISTIFQFPEHSAGIYFDSACTSFGVIISPCTAGDVFSSQGARLEGIRVDLATPVLSSNGVNPGIQVLAPVTLQNFAVTNADGTCVDIYGDSTNSNSDGFLVFNGAIFNCGAYGLQTHGGDANAGVVMNVSVRATIGSCFNNEGFLANAFYSTQSALCDGFAWTNGPIPSGYTSLVSSTDAASFTGVINSSGVLTVSALTGTVPVPSTLYGAGLVGPTISSQLTGSAGGTGTYQTNAPATSSEAMHVPHVYQCISVSACGSTAPVIGTFSSTGVWYDLGVNTDITAPAWTNSYTKYLVGGPYASLNVNSQSTFVNTYCEGNITLSAIAPPSMLVGGQQCGNNFSSWFTASSQGTGVGLQVTTGWGYLSPKVVSAPCGTTTVSATIGGFSQSGLGVGFAMGNGCDVQPNNDWSFQYTLPSTTDVCWGNGLFSRINVFCSTGITTSNQFGTGSNETQPIPYFPIGLAFGTGSAGRIVTQGSAAPSSGLHAAGEIVFNNGPSGVSSPVAWINTSTGTPGTWIALYAYNAAGVSCAANTVSLTTFTVTNGIVTHC